MNKKILLIFLLPIVLFASRESKNIIESASEGRQVIQEQEIENKPKKNNKDRQNLFYNETLLNWHYSFLKENPRAMEILGKTAENSLIKNIKEEQITNDNNTTKPIELAVVKGFCFIKDEINIGKQPSSLRLDCQTNVGSIVMFGNLVNINEKASLIVDPKYIEKNGIRFEVKSSIVTNENKTSYNIATYVNNRMIEKISYGALSTGSDEFKNASNEYLRALEESKKKQEISYINIADGSGNAYPQAVQNTNTEKPDPLDYLIKGAINVTASAVKSFADIAKEDLPYLYQIVPKTKIWIDLKVNKQGEYVK